MNLDVIINPHRQERLCHQKFVRSLPRSRAGFTLIELVTSMAILGLMMVVLFSVFDQVNKAWLQGENRVETFTDARAVLDLMSRELSQAIATNNITFYGAASAVYFVAPVNSNPQNLSDLCGMGYDFEQYNNNQWTLRINRHLIQPTTIAAANLIYSPTWTNNFYTANDTVATLATNSILGLKFQYMDNKGLIFSTWPNPTWPSPYILPSAIIIDMTNVDSRTATRIREFTPATLPPSVTNSTWRDFTTTVYLPNISP
jgi:prepilin-type N-terminal cleavage/methylation domain-containing protein